MPKIITTIKIYSPDCLCVPQLLDIPVGEATEEARVSASTAREKGGKAVHLVDLMTYN